MTITPTAPWERAMRRAHAARIKPTKRANGTYTVPSTSKPGTLHTLMLDEAGRIALCDCKGWQAGGRGRPCIHAGAVALALTFTRGHSIAVAPDDAPAMHTAPTSGRQLMRAS
jgi:SWIM zinc finger